MPVTLVNRSASRPLLVPLTNGKTLRLSPGGSSEKLPDREAESNPKVDKLRRLGLLDVLTDPRPSGKPSSRPASGPSSRSASRPSSRKKDAPETSNED